MGASNVFAVNLPKEDTFSFGTFENEGKKYMFVLNGETLKIENKEVFGWFLNLCIAIENHDDYGMPGSEELEKLQDFVDYLDAIVKTDNKINPNAICIGRVTGNSMVQCFWQVYNPEVAHNALQKVIDSDPEFRFLYEMDQDLKWENAHYWLDPLNK